MTKDTLRRLIREGVDTDALEEALQEEITSSMDYEALAHEIFKRFEEEITDLAIDELAECLLPF